MPKLANNKRARFDYEILDTLEAGIALSGQEVKAVKTGQAKLQGAFILIRGNEAWLKNAHISRYTHAGPDDSYDPTGDRKLLLHKREIIKWRKKMEGERLTIVPISLYTKAGKIKLEIGLGRGKREFEKRDTIKKRELDREARTIKYVSR
ncbi:SsrA-binding protein SmpB [Candidatus Uhrbacteria bacterium]|jgi:SsrA-binding protein|nr:SsrA-binding protein SmpB [Candidatus Uhrbacteria bacterium]